MNEDLAFWLSGCIILFFIGLYGVITKKDGIKLVISIELMVTGANAVFIGAGYLRGTLVNPLTQSYTILSLGIGGAIVGIALAVLTAIYQRRESVDFSKDILLKW